MRRDGYSAADRIDFDLGCRSLKRWADQRQNATKLVDAPEQPHNARPKMTVPVYPTLAAILDLPTDDDIALRDVGVSRDDLKAKGDELLDLISAAGEDDNEWPSSAAART